MITQLRNIQTSWALTSNELSQITHTPIEVISEYFKLKISDFETLPTVPPGLQNVVPLVSIFSSLQKLRPNPDDQQDWLRQPNSILENQIPLEVMMMSPEHLSWVSYTLDSAIQQQNL